MKLPAAPIVLLCLVAFLLPIWGGQISTDRQVLAPSGVFGALFGGSETPLLTHALFAVFTMAAIAFALWKRQIIQVPAHWISLPLVLLGAAVLASIGLSSFKVASIGVAAEWLAYLMALFAATMVLGRREGPRLLVRSLVAGCVIAAVMAIIEYNGARGADPGYRVFGGWVNPNALAGVLTVGILCALGMTASDERLEAGLGGVAVAVQILALWLTGSRAGFLAALAAIVIFFILVAIWRLGTRTAIRAGSSLFAGAALVALLIVSAKGQATTDPGAPTGIGRAVAGVGAGDQSAGFRKLLYRGALELVKERPMGYGMGTYRYYSAKPGLTTQTQFTHDTYLQLLVEAGPLALGGFLLAIGAWLAAMLRGARKLPSDINALRAGVLAAVVSMLGQGVFESNLYYFGMGMIFFLLLGAGTLIAGDAVAPEFMAKNFRIAGIGAAALVTLTLAYLGIGEMFRANARYALQNQDALGAKGAAQSALSIIPGDADALGILARLTPPPENLAYAKQAADAGPNTIALRRLAQMEAAKQDYAAAEGTFDRALALDPNNLTTLHALLDMQSGDQNDEAAKATAQRMIAVEQTPYFQVRSLPELIPTETFDARVYLADQEPDRTKKAALLQAAVDGYAKYATITVPPVIRFGDLGYGDENIPRAKLTIEHALEAAKQLMDLYRSTGVSTGELEGEVKVLEAAAADLNK